MPRIVKSSKSKNSVLIVLVFLSVLGPARGIASVQGDPNPIKRIPPTYLREDLRQLVRTLEDVHPNLFLQIERTSFNRQVDSLSGVLKDALSPREFWVLTAPLVASVGDGHTFLAFPRNSWKSYLKSGGRFFPAELRIEDGKGFIKKALTDYPELTAGSEILAINGVPFPELTKTMRQRVSGERLAYRENAVSRLFAPLLWALYPEWNSAYTVVYRLSPGDSVQHTVQLKGIPEKTRLQQRERPEPYSFYEIKEQSVGVIDFRSMRGLKAFETFLQSTFAQIRKDSIEALIIDLWRNGGGNSQLGDALIKYRTNPISK